MVMASSSASSGKLDRQIYVVASVVILGAIMSILDTTIVNVALATLGRELHAPLSTIQWVSSGYLVALATVIPMTGWASERFGAKQLWMTVVTMFIAGSVLSGFAWSAGSLIAFRVLQGLGGGMIMPAGMTILAQAAGPQRMGRVMSVVGAPMLLGPILGPVLGGLIIQYLSWRWIFFVNLPIGLVALAMARRLLPASEPRPGDRLDVTGVALISPGLALIVFGLSEIATHGGASAASVAPVLTGLVLVAAFVRHALRCRGRPLLDMRLFAKPGFAAAGATVMFVGAALFGSLLVLPLYLQVVRGEPTLDTGLLLAPQGIGAALTMPISGRLTDSIGGGRVVLFGVTVMTISTALLTTLGAHTSYWVLAAMLVVRGIGLGSTLMPAMASGYSTVSREAVPLATTTLNVMQRVGGAIGTAVLAVVLETQLRHVPGAGANGGGARPLPEAVRRRVADPLAAAFSHTLVWSAVITGLAAAPAIVLAMRVRKTRGEEPAAEAVASHA
jgi:EmrB/QacA subfamily drug resistance transporter